MKMMMVMLMMLMDIFRSFCACTESVSACKYMFLGCKDGHASTDQSSVLNFFGSTLLH